MKSIIKKILRQETYAYKILSWVYHIQSYWKPTYAQIDQMLERYLENKGTIQFIQIGANDGVANDRLNQWIRRGNWQGILVEPVPYIFNQLKNNYSNHNNLQFENAAVSHTDGTISFYSINPKMKDRIPNFERMGTLNREILEAIAKKINEPDMILEQTVDCISFTSLKKKYGISFLNLLLIDTEGFDHEILKMIDFNCLTPEVIIFEHVNMSNSNYRECLKKLKKHNYKLYRLGLDTMAVQKKLNIKKISLHS